MTINTWVKRHLFFLWALMIWLILCVPQNVVTLVMYYHQDIQESPDTTNYTLMLHKCYDLDWDVMDLYRRRGIIIIVIASFGIVGNLCSILVLQRLAAKSGFNRLLLGLGNFSRVSRLLGFWFWLGL